MIHEDTVRQLPAIDPRVETGPVRFGQDWTDCFIRGDNALFYAHVIEIVLKRVKHWTLSPSDEQDVGTLRQLQKLLVSVDERKHAPEE